MRIDFDYTPLSAPVAAGELFIADWAQVRTIFLMTDMDPPHAVALAQKGKQMKAPFLVDLSGVASTHWTAPAEIVIREGHGERDLFPPQPALMGGNTLLIDRGRTFIAPGYMDTIYVDAETGETMRSLPPQFNMRNGIPSWSIQWLRSDVDAVVLQTF